MDKTRINQKARGSGPREEAAVVKRLGDRHKNKGHLQGLGEAHGTQLIKKAQPQTPGRIQSAPLLTLCSPAYSSYSVLLGHQGTTGFDSVSL